MARHSIAMSIRPQNLLYSIPAAVDPAKVTIKDKQGHLVHARELLGELPRIEQLPREVERRGGQLVAFEYNDVVFVALPNGQWIPREIYDNVRANPGDRPLNDGYAYLVRYSENRWLTPWLVIPLFFSLFLLLLYLLGNFLAIGLGRFLWNFFEGLIRRLPVIRNVYSSVKQVTDFVFSEREVQFTRVVAVQYPRKGVWSLGFVTGESFRDLSLVAEEPVLSVLMPTSPMPATGFVITLRRSETVELDITMDQALQFIVSCGVVVPPHQQYGGEIGRQIREAIVAHRTGADRALEPVADSIDQEAQE